MVFRWVQKSIWNTFHEKGKQHVAFIYGDLHFQYSLQRLTKDETLRNAWKGFSALVWENAKENSLTKAPFMASFRRGVEEIP